MDDMRIRLVERTRLVEKAMRCIYAMLLSVIGLYAASVVSERPYPTAFVIIIMIVYTVLSYIFREVSPIILVSVILHAIFGVIAVILTGDIVMKVTMIAIILIYNGFASSYIKNKYRLYKILDIPWPTFVLAVFTTFLGNYRNDEVMIKLSYTIPVILFFMYVVMLYLQGLEDYINSARDVSALPLRQIVSMNTIVVSCIMAAVVVFIGLAQFLGLQDALFKGFKALLGVVRILIIIFIFVIRFLMGITGISDSTEGTYHSLDSLREIYDDGDNPLMNIIDMIIRVGAIIIILFLVFRFLAWLFNMLLEKRFRLPFDTREKVESFSKPVTLKESLRKDEDGFFSMEAKARRIYKKRVESVRKKYKPAKNHTTQDIAGLVDIARAELNGTGKTDSMSRITELYENVRYGEAKVDNEYLKKMKES